MTSGQALTNFLTETREISLPWEVSVYISGTSSLLTIVLDTLVRDHGHVLAQKIAFRQQIIANIIAEDPTKAVLWSAKEQYAFLKAHLKPHELVEVLYSMDEKTAACSKYLAYMEWDWMIADEKRKVIGEFLYISAIAGGPNEEYLKNKCYVFLRAAETRLLQKIAEMKKSLSPSGIYTMAGKEIKDEELLSAYLHLYRIYCLRSRLLFDFGAYDEACVDLEHAKHVLEELPDSFDSSVKYSLALYQACCLWCNQRYEQAIDLVQGALDSMEDEIDSLFERNEVDSNDNIFHLPQVASSPQTIHRSRKKAKTKVRRLSYISYQQELEEESRISVWIQATLQFILMILEAYNWHEDIGLDRLYMELLVVKTLLKLIGKEDELKIQGSEDILVQQYYFVFWWLYYCEWDITNAEKMFAFLPQGTTSSYYGLVQKIKKWTREIGDTLKIRWKYR